MYTYGMNTRTDFPTAVQKTLEILKTGESFTQNKLAEKTDLNFRTIQKIIIHIQDIQKYLKDNEVDISESSNFKLIRMKEKSGLASFPENIQKMIIKTVYYPTISNEEEILVHLLLNNAIDYDSSISMNLDSVLKQLIDAEFIVSTKNMKYHLTEDGKTIAIGALELYPEIQKIRSIQKPTLEEGIDDWIKNEIHEVPNS